MLVPAITYKETIEQEFKKIQYTDKYLWYTGSIDNYDIEVKTEGDKFAFAIVDAKKCLIGYISFRVDWYCSMAYNFGLIKFVDKERILTDRGIVTYNTAPLIASAIREVIRMIESFNLHRIDFRCVSGNPAEDKYYLICLKILRQRRYKLDKLTFHDNIKDTHGNYHDMIVYELIRREE